jgi:transposase
VVRQHHEKGVFVAKTYSQEFKDQIVALHRRRGLSFAEIAAEFNLSATTVASWVRIADRGEKKEKSPPASSKADQETIARLERELAKRDEELEILGKALAFFVRRADQ